MGGLHHHPLSEWLHQEPKSEWLLAFKGRATLLLAQRNNFTHLQPIATPSRVRVAAMVCPVYYSKLFLSLTTFIKQFYDKYFT